MENDKRELRRYEDDLCISGMGSIIMAVWESIKLVFQIILNPSFFDDLEIDDPEYRIVGIIICCMFFAVILFIIVYIHLYVGLNAVRAARGKKYKKGYFAAAIILLSLLSISLLSYIPSFADIENIDTTIASFLVDITTVYIFITIIRSTIKIRELRKKINQE